MAALSHALGVAAPTAHYLARRCVCYHRDKLVHEAMALHTPLEQVLELLETVTTIGLDGLRRGEPGRGSVLVGLHYGSYSTLLIWALAREVATGRLPSLTVLLRTTGAGQYSISPQRTAEFESVGLWSPSVHLFDRSRAEPGHVLAALAQATSDGGAVLILPDATLRPGGSTGVPVRIGRAQVCLAQGAGVLASMTGSALVPVHVRPYADSGHAVVVGPPTAVAGGEGPQLLRGVLQRLVDDTVMVDPSPWEPWLGNGVAFLPG